MRYPLKCVEPVPLRLKKTLHIGIFAARNATMELRNEMHWQKMYGPGSIPSADLDPDLDVMPGEPGYGGGRSHPSSKAAMAKTVLELNGGQLGANLNEAASYAWRCILPSNHQVLAEQEAIAVHHNQLAKDKGILEEFVSIPRSEMRIIGVENAKPVVMPVVPKNIFWSNPCNGDSKEDAIIVE